MKKLLLSVLTLLLLGGSASACSPSFAGYGFGFAYNPVLQPTFMSYAVPVTYSYAGALPVGVVQSTWQVTAPVQAAYYGAPQTFTTEYLVQQPVQVTAAYLAPAVTYGAPLYFGGGYGNGVFFDRTYLGVRSGFHNSFRGNNVAVASARGNTAVASAGNFRGGAAAAVSNGNFQGNNAAVAVSGRNGSTIAASGRAVSVRQGPFGGTVVRAR